MRDENDDCESVIEDEESAAMNQQDVTIPSSCFKGLQWSSLCKVWMVHYYTLSDRIFLGYYKDELEAAKRYDEYMIHAGYSSEPVNLNPSYRVPILSKETERLNKKKKNRKRTPSEKVNANDTQKKTIQAKKNRSKGKPPYTCPYRGVSWNNERRVWKATIQLNRNKLYLGKFETAEQAAQKYNEVSRNVFSDRAILNDIPTDKKTYYPDNFAPVAAVEKKEQIGVIHKRRKTAVTVRAVSPVPVVTDELVKKIVEDYSLLYGDDCE